MVPSSDAPMELTDGINRWPGRFGIAAPQMVRDILVVHQVRFVSCLGWRVGPEWSIPERVLGDTLFFVPMAGRVVITCRGREELLEPGGIAVMPEGCPHQVRHADGNTRFDVLVLHAIYRTPFGLSSLDGAAQCVWPLADCGHWQRELIRLTSWGADLPDLAVAVAHGVCRRLLAELVIDGFPVALPDPQIHPRLAEVIAQARRHPGRNTSIREMARGCGFSAVRFRQLFHQATGMSPKAWIDRIRLNHAGELLRQSGLPVAEIAQRCGFSGIRQFQVRFKAVFGTSPSDWRQQSGL